MEGDVMLLLVVQRGRGRSEEAKAQSLRCSIPAD